MCHSSTIIAKFVSLRSIIIIQYFHNVYIGVKKNYYRSVISYLLYQKLL